MAYILLKMEVTSLFITKYFSNNEEIMPYCGRPTYFWELLKMPIILRKEIFRRIKAMNACSAEQIYAENNVACKVLRLQTNNEFRTCKS
jgi:hypothetical protein